MILMQTPTIKPPRLPDAAAPVLPEFEGERCPVEITLDVIGGKWKPLIVYFLQNGALRFGELQRRMPMVTRRMLTQHLREMEADGIVHREVYKQVPPKVEYSLTDAGLRLREVLDKMLEYGLWYAGTMGQNTAKDTDDD